MIRVHATWHASFYPLVLSLFLLPFVSLFHFPGRLFASTRFGYRIEPNFALMKIDFREFDGSDESQFFDALAAPMTHSLFHLPASRTRSHGLSNSSRGLMPGKTCEWTNFFQRRRSFTFNFRSLVGKRDWSSYYEILRYVKVLMIIWVYLYRESRKV